MSQQVIRWIKAGICRLLSGAVGTFFLCLGLCGCTGESKKAGAIKKGIDPNDPSIVYDEPFQMNSGFKNYNGKAYDKASLFIEPNATLVIPDESTGVGEHDQGNVILIYMEKSMNFGSHNEHDASIADERRHMGCAIKLEKGELLLGSFGEYSFKEGALAMRFLLLVPPKTKLIRRAGLIGEAKGPSGRDPKPALTKKKEGGPECWLAPTVEDGWHAIPAVADPERRASK